MLKFENGDHSKVEIRGSEALVDEHQRLAREPASSCAQTTPCLVLQGPGSRVRVSYLAQAAMGRMDCAMELSAKRCGIWTGSQLQTVDQ